VGLSTELAMAFGPDAESDRAAFFKLLKSLDHRSGLELLIESEIDAADSLK
jgi:hypothetical protein